MVKAKSWIKLREFSGTPTKNDFKLAEEDLPEIKDGGAVILFLFHKLLANGDRFAKINKNDLYMFLNGI